MTEPDDAAASSAQRNRDQPGASAFAWGVWALSLVIALAYVGRYGADVPRYDDYAVVPQLCGKAPVTLGWLWSQHSEHRIPLARLVLLGVFGGTGADPRPVMGLIVGLLAAAAAALLVAAGRAPGGRTYADAFLPLTMLGLGHHPNLLWAIQITYVAPVALLCAMTALLVGRGQRPSIGRAAGVGACLALLPLCNAGGLLLIPAPTFWLLATAWSEWKRGDRRRAAGIAACAAPAGLLAVFYLVGYASPSHHAAPGGLVAGLRTTFQFLATGFGPAGIVLWPWSGVAAGLATLGATAVLLASWFREAGRSRIGGLIAALASAGLLALATGWGRSGEGAEAGLQPRYATLAAPALGIAYLAFAYGGGRLLRTLAPMVLFATSCVLIWPNAEDALQVGRRDAEQAAAFDRERASGVPIFRLVRRHVPFLYPSQPPFHDLLTTLGEAGVGEFKRLAPDPAFRERPVELRPGDVRLARWEDGAIVATGPDPWVRFDLPEPVRVAGVRIRYDHRNDDGSPARFKLAWRGAGGYNAPETQYGDWNLPTGDDLVTTVWIDEPVAWIRLQPDNRPCRFRIRELTLLIEP
ncbi:hypothetical protein [Paludisphaera soli]|uniref:hypothetical protein n=1 Tax=Paludisphaera soli TaxID=2712865 RepID=UPI0013EBE6F8|nr:hypothetical protein [Paludisphaera soli]